MSALPFAGIHTLQLSCRGTQWLLAMCKNSSTIRDSLPLFLPRMSFIRRLLSWLPFRILDFYIARQVLISTFLAVSVLSVILVLGQVFRVLIELLVKDMLTIEQLPGFVWNMFAYSLSFTVPWGILTAVLLVFGRMSADNELTSMRMAGMSLVRICFPVALVATGLSVLCFYVNTKIAPSAYKEIKAQKYGVALDNPAKLFEPKQVLDIIPGYMMYCEDKEGNHLKNFITFTLNDTEPPEPTNFIMAKDVEIVPHKEERKIEMNLSEMTFISHQYQERPDAFDPTIKRRGELEIKAAGMTSMSPMDVDLKKFWQKANRQRVDGMSMKELKSLYVDTNTDPSMLSGPSEQILRDYLTGLSEADRKRLRSEAITEFNSRYSFSFACMTLTLVGVCFGIAAQRRETSAGFVLSLIVGILYFAFIMLGALLKDKPEYYPHYWVWLPNVLFGGIGLAMFWRHQTK